MRKRKIALILLIVLIPWLVFAASQTTSSSTASDLITKIRYILNEPTAYFWTDAELASYLNDAVYDVVARTRCLETQETLSLTSGTSQYSLSTSYIAIKGAIYYNGTTYKGLIPGEIKSYGHSEDIEEPEFYYDWNNKVELYPDPNTSGTSLIVYLLKKPTGISATTSSIETPAIYDRALVLYSSAQAFYKDNQFAKGGRLMAEYFEELNRYRVDFVEPVVKESVKIK